MTPHPNAHTETELKWIRDLHHRNPHIFICEMYGKLRSQKGYARHPGSLYRIFKALGFSYKAPSAKKKRKPQKYHTPDSLFQADIFFIKKDKYIIKFDIFFDPGLSSQWLCILSVIKISF